MGFWGSLGKGLLKAAPIAASFIPGVGPIAGMAIGAATGAARGAMGGGGLKGAIGGGIQGATDAKAAKGLGPSMSTAGKIGEIGKSAVGGMGSNQQPSPMQMGRGGFQQNPGMGGRKYNQNNPFLTAMQRGQMQGSMNQMQQNPYMQQGGGQGSQAPKGGPWSQYTGEDVGHEGTTKGGMNRQQFRDAWMSSGISNSQQMDDWLAKNGGQRLNDAGVVRTPFGETLDMGIAYKTGNGRPGWTDIGMNEQSPQQGWTQPPQQQYQPQFEPQNTGINGYGNGIGPSQEPQYQEPLPQMQQQEEEPRQRWGRARFQ
jgi:hypothetical protein